jgi:orotate phosphoribosyltransferase
MGYHFVYKSAKHGPGYVNVDPVLSDVGLIKEACDDMAGPFLSQFDTVIAPAIGGIPLAVLCALYARSKGYRDVSAVWAEKDDEEFVINRDGFIEAIKGKRVLIVDDVMTNANDKGSVYKLCRLVESLDGVVIGVSLICNRCQGTAEQLKVPRLRQLGSVNFTAVPPEACDQCDRHEPIVEDIGHGDSFKETHPDYPGGYIKLLS